MEAGDRDSGLRLAELVAAFSLATDLGLGQPMEHVLRSWVIAARLGDHMGVELDDRGALYYVATLAWVGCVADTPEVAAWFGDDIAFRRDGLQVDLAGPPMLGFMLRHVGAGAPALHSPPLSSGRRAQLRDHDWHGTSNRSRARLPTVSAPGTRGARVR